ncbi:C-C chemokine receptor type 3-like [Ostrea edulis]|uniref:C-C chemokine receptor type 3-like n=1 Tax=Ostrea edulis TaxID=37623 RepID=UPI00209451F4|nr:C-C chemokine receptor type 3-like [Ostrea edulis]
MINFTSLPLFTSSGVTATGTKTQKSLDVIDAIYPPILILVGVTCNVFIILVMRTKQFCRQSTSVFMTAGAVNDALSLVISMTTHWLYVSFDGIYYRNEVKGICKFLDFYGWGNCDFGILITSMMTVDRALAMMFPLKFKTKSIRRARIIVVILAFIVVAKEFHFLIGSNMVPESRKERLCDVYPGTESYQFFWKRVWPCLHLVYLSVCFIIIIVSNTILVLQLLKSSKFETNFRKTSKFKENSRIDECNNLNYNARVRRQLHTIVPMLVGESLVLLILTFPFSVQLSISGYNPDFYSSPDMGLLFSATFYMLYTNKCVTFFVYLVTGSKFRQSLKQIFRRCIQGKDSVRRTQFDNFSKWYTAKGDHSKQVWRRTSSDIWSTDTASRETMMSDIQMAPKFVVSTHL